MEEIQLTDAVSRVLAAFKPLVLTIAVIFFIVQNTLFRNVMEIIVNVMKTHSIVLSD